MAISLFKKIISNYKDKYNQLKEEYKPIEYTSKRKKQKTKVEVRHTEDDLEQLMTEIETSKMNLIKNLYECLGEDFGDHEAVVSYKNYAYDMILAQNTTEDGSTILIKYNNTGEFSMAQLENFSGEPGDTGLSDGMLNFICHYETGKNFGYSMQSKDLNGYDLGDAGGHKTYGYGILYHPVQNKFMDTIKSTWTQQELENLFKVHAAKTAKKIDDWANKNNIQLQQCQKDAIASGMYNFGPGFLNKSVCKMIIKNPNDPIIKDVWSHMSDVQGKKYPGLITRRKAEANWYFGLVSK